MAWFKVDDQFWSHPKVNGLSAEAGWLWTRAGSYCGQHLTNGFVSVAALAMLQGDEQEAAELVESGLWIQVDGGYQFHDWTKYQPTRDAVLQVREARSEAGRKGGLKSGASRREANSEANASAKGEANREPNGKQDRTPSPVPSPSPYLTKDLSSHVGLSPISPARDGDMTDYYEPIKQVLVHDAAIPDPSVDEIHAWVTYVTSKARTAVKDERAYAIRAAERFPTEADDWFVKHRRNQMRAVGQ